jgi:hypothetical protein
VLEFRVLQVWRSERQETRDAGKARRAPSESRSWRCPGLRRKQGAGDGVEPGAIPMQRHGVASRLSALRLPPSRPELGRKGSSPIGPPAARSAPSAAIAFVAKHSPWSALADASIVAIAMARYAPSRNVKAIVRAVKDECPRTAQGRRFGGSRLSGPHDSYDVRAVMPSDDHRVAEVVP